MILGALVSVVALAIYVWQDGVNRCQDGDRYTSGVRQPTPFHRRFCLWPPRLLMVTTWLSFIALSGLLGSWKSSLIFCTLPGVAFCASRPTTVDAPAMLLAWGSSIVLSTHPSLAICMALAGGLFHERAPVFAALYAWSPVPLLGLVVPLLLGLRKPAAPNRASGELADQLVGHGTLGALVAHHDYVDLLSQTGLVWALRGLPLMAAHLGATPAAWASLAVAFASRISGTDTTRFLMWAAPPLCAGMGHAPEWMLVAHVVTFRRAAQ